MPPKVSIIIPCYKVDAYLNQCVESVLAQTMLNLEIILVDDGSPDRVPEMCDAWASRDTRIRVIHKLNAGLGMACNSGLELARGTYVAFVDSDDWVDPEMYETLYNAAEQYGAQMVFSGLRRVDGEGKIIGTLPHKEQFLLCKSKEEIEALACDMVASAPHVACERSLQMSAKVVLYHRETLEKHHIHFVSEREVLSEDLHFNLNMLAHSTCVCVLPQFFYNYRSNGSSISQHIALDQFEKIKFLYQYTQQECRALSFSPQIQQRIQRMFIGYTRQYTRQLAKSSIPLGQLRKAIRNIVHDSIWDSVWGGYPLHHMPVKHRLHAWLFRMKWSRALITMLKLG